MRYDDEDVALTHVFDVQFSEIGFFLANGGTYRLKTNRDGIVEEEFLGNHSVERSLERLTGAQGPFRLSKDL